MEAASIADVASPIFTLNNREHIAAHELLTAFHHYANKISVLSLDCFDTLLWRKLVEPKDLFFDLQQQPLFRTLGIAAINRIDAESLARQLTFVRAGHYEVTLNDIYRTGFSSLTQAERNELVKGEINEEIKICYAFPPIVELIRTAYAHGLKIIIVSDTYLQEPQLRHLLASVLPSDILPMINQLFCSCEYNQSKTNGLFSHVLQQVGGEAHTILHIGDNHNADFRAARLQGLNALHLLQFNKKITEYLRLQSTAATIMDTSIHHTRSLVNPFRGLLAKSHTCTDKPESLVGYLSMGPMMYTFARYLCEEVDQLKQTGIRPKVLFLMRDAYLPALACETLRGEPLGKRVRISRLSAIAASFRSREDIEIYLSNSMYSSVFAERCKRLLIPDTLAQKMLEQVNRASNPEWAFAEWILQKENVDYICQQSKKYWERLKKYIQREAEITAGDPVLFVDIGYVGRTQNALTPILKEELDVADVTGRYFLSLNVPEWQKTRRGLIDPTYCDDRAMSTLFMGASLLEELFCSPDKSVADYDEEGHPIFAETHTQSWQHEKNKLIQAECLRFIRDAKAFFDATGSHFPLSMLRDTTIAELARSTFFPMKEEIAYLKNYSHDTNLGADTTLIAVKDSEEELTNLRRQGLSFNHQLPHGLRSAGFELTLALMAQRRHGFATTLDDMSMRQENVLVITSQGAQMSKNIIDATPTHDGYFSLWFKVDKHDAQLAILFGLNYKAIQIECVELIKAAYFYTEIQKDHTQDMFPHLVFNEMTEKEDHFFECLSGNAALITTLQPVIKSDDKFIFRVVFRPIIKRKAQ